MNIFTGERIVPNNDHLGFTYNRHLVVYEFAKKYAKNKSVIDCGCGEGYGANIIASVASTVIGIDKSKKTIARAIQKYHQPNLSFLPANVELALPIASDSVDVVICLQVIEHLRRPEVLVQEIHRVLRKGGILIMTTPNKKTFSPTGKELDPYHYIEYTQETLQKLLSPVFSGVEAFHLTGNTKVLAKLQQDMDMAKRYVRYDIARLHKWAPRLLLKLLYTIALNTSRRRMHGGKNVDAVRTSDFTIKEGGTDAMHVLDLLSVCTK